eukprot:TRINITY_DN11114_c0_g1_i1.p1 TRINITY_DN11114_c0_g1~~TRINITY_DN11114_c0_g1_i1.p1  ORF type:complete len:171 (+),score=46.67 TRINITY_DN11114_c0_g1_i1:50-562(+)
MLTKICFIILLITLAAQCQSVDNVPEHAIVPYSGHCTISADNTSYVCEGTGTGAEFMTRITPTGDVLFEFNRIPGSISKWTSQGTISGKTATETGSFTFGIHQEHHKHVLNYKGTGIFDPEDNMAAMNAVVEGGSGEWEGAHGLLGYVTEFEDNGKNWYGAVNFFLHQKK